LSPKTHLFLSFYLCARVRAYVIAMSLTIFTRGEA